MIQIQQKIIFSRFFFPAAVSGILSTLAFPDTGLHFLAFVCLVPLLSSLKGRSMKQGFASGFVMGLCGFLSLLYWIVPTIHQYGGLPSVAALATSILLCGYLALYPALFCLIYCRIQKIAWGLPLFSAAAWTGLEYVRTYALTGFPWGVIGYSQFLNLRLIQIADVFGVYGVSFLLILVNVTLGMVWQQWRSRQGIQIGNLAVTLFFIGAALVYGELRIKQISSKITGAEKITVSVVQGNINQNDKWNTVFKTTTVEKYIHLTGKILEASPALVVWPETTLPFYYGYDLPMTRMVDDFIREAGTYFLIGAPAFRRDNETVFFYNRAYLIDPFSVTKATYDKQHLVPFGEYVPMGNYLKFLGKMTAQAGDFSPGTGNIHPLYFGSHSTGVLICFEILFPEISAEFVRNGAGMLTTITNDAWFGRTSAPRQHFSIAVFRAVENRRSVIRCANTGISGLIDPIGHITHTTNLFSDAAVSMTVPELSLVSRYTAFGALAVPGFLFAICFVFVLKEAAGKTGNNRQERAR